MTNKKDNQKSSKSDIAVGIGAATLAVAAAAAGAYFLYGSKNAERHRKAVKIWMLKARGEVLEKIETMKDTLTEESYNRIIDTVIKKYASVKGGSTAEAEALGKELKSHWSNIKKHFTTIKPVKTAPKSTKPRSPRKKKTTQ